MPKTKTARFVSLSDLHVPDLDPEAFEWAVDIIKGHKPNVVVLNGDLFEADAASRWPSERAHTLDDEYREACATLASIRRAAPKGCRLVFVPGNHDANITAPHRISKKIRSLVDYRQHQALRSELLHWEHNLQYVSVPKLCCFRLGQVTFLHGFKAARNSDLQESLLYGEEWGLTVRGHTHHPVSVTQVNHGAIRIPRWFANSGCLVSMDPPPEYVRRTNTQAWGQAVVIGEAAVSAQNQKGRWWDAETLIKKLAWDTDHTYQSLIRRNEWYSGRNS